MVDGKTITILTVIHHIDALLAPYTFQRTAISVFRISLRVT
jgi:hypothetical protein